ncbi:MAG TPA: alpha/beta fold hydrolase [Myxococcales bacterium]|nr:alpha/beta fold hydrolase [Myxococcales bacterium]
MPLTRNGSHSVHYRTWGEPDAPVLLMIMGLGLSCHAWDTLPERLAARMRVLAFDHRGTGLSGPTSWTCSMAHLASDARAVLDAESIPSAFVFGISMGGMVAQELALRWPERVRALALGATFASFRSSEKLSLDALVDLTLLNCGSQFATPERVGRLLVSQPFRERAFQWLRRDVGQVRTLRSGLAQLLAVIRHGPADRLRRLRTPTFVISGDADRVVPVENSYRLAELIPGARLHILRGAGHVFPLEREDETVEQLLAHFDSCARSAACG